MATFGPPLRDSASNYNAVYANPESRFDSGVENARTERSGERSPSRPGESRRFRTQARQYVGRQETNSLDQNLSPQNQKVATRYLPNTNQDTAIQTRKNPKIKVSAATKATATLFFIITNSWSMIIWSFIQVWAGIMSSLFFGLTAAVTYSVIGDTVSAVATWFGYTEPNLMSLGFWGLITAAAIGWVSLLVAALHAKFWLLHPLQGRGATLKTGTFLLAVVLYAIPLFNIFPWIIIWALSVKIYPK